MAFNNSRDFEIAGGAHNTVYGNQYNNTYYSSRDDATQILQKLADQAAINACHDAEARYPQPNCHPNTRVKTLNSLDEWIRDRDGHIRVCWVNGSAGVGKSAIAQKVSEDHPDQLCGAFFFSRNDPSRDKLNPFVATLAYQCCTTGQLKDIVGPMILAVIRSHPNIFRTSAENQFQKLLLEPFSQLTEAQRQSVPNLIVVDGLDECVDHRSQQRLLGIIDIAITFTTRPTQHSFPFVFLLCSRPEPLICHGINNAAFASCLSRVEISGTTIRFLGYLSESDIDIQQYLLKEFSTLRAKYYRVLRHEGEVWPSEEQVMNLVERASGQFIFAVTVINYLDTSDERPQDRLETILHVDPGDLPESPYPALDVLYRQVLSKCLHWKKVYSILRFLLSPYPAIGDLGRSLWDQIQWHSPSVVSMLFQLQPGEIEILLSKLHSIIHIPDDENSQIHILHASFSEFLLHTARSGDYHVAKYSELEYSDLITVFLVHTLSSYTRYYPPYCTSEQSFDDAFLRWQEKVGAVREYAVPGLASRCWSDCCCQINTPSVGLIAELEKVDPFVAGAMALTAGIYGIRTLLSFRDCLQWAMSLGEKTPRTFVARMEAFLDGFYLGYSKEVLRHHAILYTFLLECGFPTCSNWAEATGIAKFACAYYNKWWKEGLVKWRMDPLFLPATSESRKILPDGWVIVHITPTSGNRELLKRVHDRICRSLGYGAREMFDNDILHNSSESVSQNLVQEEDLAAFKALLYKRRDLFTHLVRPLPCFFHIPISGDDSSDTPSRDTREVNGLRCTTSRSHDGTFPASNQNVASPQEITSWLDRLSTIRVLENDLLVLRILRRMLHLYRRRG
ncbi:hypothetical protein VNI00_012650 [Paramarasmius palmivorus]|uniref:Nephrocystin 3-like N-terminal domain-containing protein n=1 Tax=Paramarasmius palmivorus TaxID=297713 RepID=A0AAW0C3T1_9AGAR